MTQTLDGMNVQQLDDLINRANATKRAVQAAEAKANESIVNAGEVKVIDGKIFGLATSINRSTGYRKAPGQRLEYCLLGNRTSFNAISYERHGFVVKEWIRKDGGDSNIAFPESLNVIARMLLIDQSR